MAKPPLVQPILVAPWKVPKPERQPPVDLPAVVLAAAAVPPKPVEPVLPAPKGRKRKPKVGQPAPGMAPQDDAPPVEVPPDPKADPKAKAAAEHVPIPMPFGPISPLEIMASSNPHVLTVMLRQLRDMQGIQPDTSNGALAVMTGLADSFKHGKDISQYAEAITVHLTGRGDRRELISELSEVLDDERTIEIFRSRAKFEDFLHGCFRRSDITIAEAIAIQSYFNGELTKIYSRRGRRSGGGGSGDPITSREPTELVTKSNLPAQLHRKELQNKFSEATPQEREILRKLGFKVQNMIAARLVKTTTETIELVEPHDDDTVRKPGLGE